MPRLPDTTGIAGGKSQRQRVWEAIRGLAGAGNGGAFSADDLSRASKVEMQAVREYVVSLTAAGYLRMDGLNVGAQRVKKLYVLARDNGIEAPRVRRDGTPVQHGAASQAMWAALTALDAFTGAMLAEIAKVKPCTALNYGAALARAGYLEVVRPGKGSGVGAMATVWRCALKHRQKPLAPMVTRLKAVYDPNIQAIVWQEGASAAADKVEIGEVIE